jgi:phenylpyruvate tautomerase PptA (4-oxalocrotonate tautomerase family)
MLDAYIPDGALAPEAESGLLEKLTDLLIRHEGVDPSNTAARSLAWVFLHRPARVFAAGRQVSAPHYKFVASVPEGQFNRERRTAMIESITKCVLDAENGAHPRQPERVWVFTPEVPDGTWGYAGRIYGLEQIAGYVLGDADKGRQYAERVLSARRETSSPTPGQQPVVAQ